MAKQKVKNKTRSMTERRGRSASLFFNFEGEKQSLKNIAEQVNIPYRTLYNRIIVSGYSLKEAIKYATRPEKTYKYKNKLMTLKELHALCTNGLTIQGLHFRINSGNYSIQQALTSKRNLVGQASPFRKKSNKNISIDNDTREFELNDKETKALDNYMTLNKISMKDILLNHINYQQR